MSSPKVTVIIPTLNAGNFLHRLLENLLSQTKTPDEIIVIDSESDDDTCAIAEKTRGIKLIRIKRQNFNHGTTRRFATSQSHGDYILFTTQDALPVDNNYIKAIIEPFTKDDKIAVVSGRQIAWADASAIQKHIRNFNYPSYEYVRSLSDLPKHGMKTFFLSDVCSAYRKDIYDELGGHDATIFGEDMLFAAKSINAGYKLAYTPEAKIYHSHNYSLNDEYRRNYLDGYVREIFKDTLHNSSVTEEGKKLFCYVVCNLLKEQKTLECLHFQLICLAKYLGNIKGRHIARMQMKGCH